MYNKHIGMNASEDVLFNYTPMGNLTSVQKQASGGTTTTIATYSYSSSWGDLLTQYNSQNITYDNAGNPLTYNNGQAYTFTRGL